ncbi:MAG TPA: hypothetical protein VJL35_11870 [Gemmatimonadaceae bacterium]|nr:hypothetical protein [Gemmatimonadaceae bacterium]
MSPSLVLHPDAGRHLNDDDLVSILDGASSTVAAWSDHFTSCVTCHTRVTTLSSAANALRVAYQETHIPEHLAELPPRLRVRKQGASSARSVWTAGRVTRRATVILALAAVGTAAAATIRRLARDAGISARDASPSAASAPVITRVDTASIAFSVSSGVITLDFASVPATLRARLGSSDTLRLQVTSSDSLHPATAASLIALPDGIRIVNTNASGAAYDVVLPSAAQELRIRLAGRQVSVLHRPGMSSDRNIIVPVEVVQ